MAGFPVRALLDLQMAALELCPYMEVRALVSPDSSVVGWCLCTLVITAECVHDTSTEFQVSAFPFCL